jgi:hypothetical protein
MAESGRNLTGILKPREFEEFAVAREEQKPYLATGQRARFSNFFTMKTFESLVNQTGFLTPERLEVMLDTKKIPPPQYFEQIQVMTGQKIRLLNERLQALIDRGASVVLNDIDSLSPGAKSLRKIISAFTGGKVESNLYYSQPGHQAFTVHFDVHDVFAFQITGDKQWKIYQQKYKHPVNHLAFRSGDTAMHEREKGAVSMGFTLKQGDFLYIPAGYYHQAICTDSSSLHITFSSVEMIGLDVLSEMFDHAVLQEIFRTPIAREMGDRPVADYLKALAKSVERLMEDEAFVTRMEQKLENFAYDIGNISFKKNGERKKRSP